MRAFQVAALLSALPLSAQAVFQNADKPGDPICPRIKIENDSVSNTFGSGGGGRGNSTGGRAGATLSETRNYQNGTQVFPAGSRKNVQAFAAMDEKGMATTLDQLKGKIVLVALWSAKCEPSAKLLMDLGSLYPKREQFGFEVLAVNFDENRVQDNVEGGWRAIQRFRQRAKAFFDQSHLPLYVPGVGKQGVSNFMEEVNSVPVLLVVDRDGNLASMSIGYEPNLAAVALSRVLREQAAAPAGR